MRRRWPRESDIMSAYEREQEVTVQVTSCEVWTENYSNFAVATYYYHVAAGARQLPMVDCEHIATFDDREGHVVTVNADKSIFMTHETALEIAKKWREGTL